MPWGRLFICSGLHDSRPVAPSANSLTMRIPRGSREPRIQIGERKLRSTLSAIAFLALSAASFGQQPSNAPYLDPTLSPEKRAADLVSRMTLEDKVLQMQNSAPAIPRLGVPVYNWWNEALHGVAQHRATVFPEPIGLGASFDPELVHKMADVISTEARAKFHEAMRRPPVTEVGPGAAPGRIAYLDYWSPNVNIFRDPRWGRGQETYGEDPFLTSRMGVAFVKGMQGDDPRYFKTIATPKHFAVHSGPEPSRHAVDVQVSKHDMADTYLPAFRATVTEGKAGSVMCAYNRVNGEPACANSFLLEDQLRGAWKFDGYVSSDCDAVADIFNGHHYTRTMAEAVAISLKKGMDNECADFFTKAADNSDYIKYLDAVKQGLLTEKDLDVPLIRLFTARIRLGLLDPPETVPYAQTPESEIDSAPHREVALKIARESIVLLKNDGILPFGQKIKKIAVVGPLAESVRVLHGNYAGTASHAVTA